MQWAVVALEISFGWILKKEDTNSSETTNSGIALKQGFLKNRAGYHWLVQQKGVFWCDLPFFMANTSLHET